MGQADFALGHADTCSRFQRRSRPLHPTSPMHLAHHGEEVFFLPFLPISSTRSVAFAAGGRSPPPHPRPSPATPPPGRLLLEAERLRRSFLHARLNKHSLGVTPSLRPGQQRTTSALPHVTPGRRVQRLENPALLPYHSSNFSQSKASRCATLRPATRARCPTSADKRVRPGCPLAGSVLGRRPTTGAGTIRCRAGP